MAVAESRAGRVCVRAWGAYFKASGSPRCGDATPGPRPPGGAALAHRGPRRHCARPGPARVRVRRPQAHSRRPPPGGDRCQTSQTSRNCRCALNPRAPAGARPFPILPPAPAPRDSSLRRGCPGEQAVSGNWASGSAPALAPGCGGQPGGSQAASRTGRLPSAGGDERRPACPRVSAPRWREGPRSQGRGVRSRSTRSRSTGSGAEGILAANILQECK